MKILPPTLRKNYRYFAFELIGSSDIKRSELIHEIYSCASALVGDLGASECELKVLHFDSSQGIIRCARDRIVLTRAILASVTSINHKSVIIYVLGISGTVRGATTKYLE